MDEVLVLIKWGKNSQIPLFFKIISVLPLLVFYHFIEKYLGMYHLFETLVFKT